ncbi:hypothetical protein BJV74DRAFT_843610 [Russula compacta]|nr:hypothetical protein BJV74DRAFT_843610 [Russula compacta]
MATVLPTFIFVVVFLLNLFLIAAHSFGAVPFGGLTLILSLTVFAFQVHCSSSLVQHLRTLVRDWLVFWG